MLSINEIPKQICCQNCGKTMDGKAASVENEDGTKKTTILLCKNCLTKAAALLNKKHIETEEDQKIQKLPKIIRTLVKNIRENTFDFRKYQHKETYFKRIISIRELKVSYGFIGYVIWYCGYEIEADLEMKEIKIDETRYGINENDPLERKIVTIAKIKIK